MTFRLLRPAALVLFASIVASAAPFEAARAQQDNNFFGNLFKPPGQVRSGAQPAQPDETESMVTRIDRLESQLRQMTGQMEQLQYRNQQLEQQVRMLQGGTGAAVPPVAETGRRSDVFDPSAQASAPGAPRPLGATAPSGPAGNAPMDLGTLSGAVAGGGAAPPPAGNTPKDLFDVAFGSLQRQDYAVAGQTFEQFVKLYPNDRAAPDAYYWLGESQYLRKSYKEAAQNFLKVSTDFPNAVKAPDALLRLGQSLAAIGEKDAACATLNAVGNKYPRASATIKQGVEREQKRAGC
ncbi:tol-pal system protein YbgF [Ancylobacter sp.]|uniref:tol-pal system protein YbgF n=1 Tax=Ancylobacter sp. TaxID=1872567 RepID=UPI003D1230EF